MKPLLIFLTLLSCSLASFAQTPEEIAAKYYDTWKNSGMSAVVPMLHPEEMEKFQATFTPIIEGALASPEGGEFGYFASDDDPAKLRPMTPPEFMKAFFNWMEKKLPVFNSVAANSKVEVLGHVTENDLKHVVVRSTMALGTIKTEKLTVLTVKDYQGKPMVMLPGELKAIEIILKKYVKTP